MRVLQVHNRQLATGGVDYVIENDRQMLEAMGHDVDQFFLRNDEAVNAPAVRQGVNAIWNGAVGRQLTERIESFRPDVMHVHTPFPLMSPVVFRVGAKAGVPTVASVHSFRYSCITGLLYRGGEVCELCVGKTLKLAGVAHRCYHDSVLGSAALTASLAIHRGLGTFDRGIDVWMALSQFVARKLMDEGIPADRIVVNPNTVPDPGFVAQGSGSRALFLGRLEPEKGVRTLLRAWESMASPPPLTIAGEGSLQPEVERFAAQNPAVTFAGWLDRPAALDALASARFLVLPSEWYESGPLVPIESFAVGTPVIASDVGNFSEMVEHGVTGYTFTSGSAESLAEVVGAAWSTNHVDEMRQAARRHYEAEHTEDANAARLLEAYERAVAARELRSAA